MGEYDHDFPYSVLLDSLHFLKTATLIFYSL